MAKSQDKEVNNLRTKTAFKIKIKSIFRYFHWDFIEAVLGKSSPGKRRPLDPKPNPIPNIMLTLALILHGGLFSSGIFS